MSEHAQDFHPWITPMYSHDVFTATDPTNDKDKFVFESHTTHHVAEEEHGHICSQVVFRAILDREGIPWRSFL